MTDNLCCYNAVILTINDEVLCSWGLFFHPSGKGCEGLLRVMLVTLILGLRFRRMSLGQVLG